MMDFNEVVCLAPTGKSDRDAVRASLLARLETVLMRLLPEGKVRGGKYVVGNVRGEAGESLEIALTGARAGLWFDHATSEGGDIFDLIARSRGLDVTRDFTAVLEAARPLIDAPASVRASKRLPEPPVDELGPQTGKWDYLDAEGKLIACVYRFEPAPGKKAYRPWDAKRRKMAPPEPRPLYNQPGLVCAEQVVLVEGEKCAQALIEAGVCATTAMHGANAPIDKTDWAPLAGKHVILWPDRDKPGWAYAEAAAQAALGAGARRCEILMVPEALPEGWDAADALAECDEDGLPRFDVMGFIQTGDRIPIEAEIELPPDAYARPEGGEDGEGEDTDPGASWGTEDGLARVFTRRYGEDWRYCAMWGKWYVWTGQRWNDDQVLYVNHLARGVCRGAAARAHSARLKAKLASAGTISAVERIARSEPLHAVRSEQWDADPWLLNTPAGVVDLRSGQIRTHTRSDLMTKITTASARGACPMWHAFLEQVTGGDAALQAYLQRMAGYCLTGSTQEHALFFLYGTGSNGKSVFVNTLFTVLGDYAANAPMETFMETRGDRHPTELAGLRGARLVTATETEQGRRWNESKIKELTGGDRISARFMRQDFFTFLPQFKLVISGNHKPSIRNVDEAMKRRMHLIPFEVTIPPEQRDKTLPTRLLAERDGILAWALEGCLAWHQDGLKPPESVQRATEAYFDEEDAIGEFLEEECQQHAHARESVADLYRRWKERTERRGEYVGTSRWLTQQLVARGFERIRTSLGAKGLKGISLRPKDYGERLPYTDD